MKLSVPDMWEVLRNDCREAKSLAVAFHDSLVARGVEVSFLATTTIDRYREELKDKEWSED